MNVICFDSPAAWTRGVASWWRDRLRVHPQLNMCLPTGLTPLPIYEEMVRSVRAGHVSFSQASIWGLDEFGDIARDDPGRLENTLRRHLVDVVDLAPGACHFLDPSRPDLDGQCRRFEPAGRFDLVLLGIGANGHLGMNEPGSAAGSPTRRVELHQSTIAAAARYFAHDRLPRWGATVGLGPILSAKEVWMLASGASKADVVRRVVRDEISEELPASLLRRHANCSLFVDAEAGARL